MPPKPERRPQILKAAAQLFQAQGFHATTMDDLAAKLKLNKATVYHHFKGGKQELLFSIIERPLKGVSEELDALDATASPEDRMRAYLAAMVDFQSRHPVETIVYFQQRPWLKTVLSRSQYKTVREYEAHARGLLRSALEEGIAAGDFIEVDPELTTFGLMNLVTSSYEWFRHRKNGGDEDIAAFYWQIAFEGLKR